MAEKEYKEIIWSKREIKRQEKSLLITREPKPKNPKKTLIQALKYKAYNNRERIKGYCEHKRTKKNKNGTVTCKSCYKSWRIRDD